MDFTLSDLLKNNPDLATRNPQVGAVSADPPKRMHGKPEEDFQQQIIDFAHLNGWRVAHFRTVRIQRKDGSVYYATPVQADGEGFPDLVLLKGNLVIVAEIKSEKGKLSDAQRDWLSAWEMTEADVYVWRPQDWDEIEKRLR
jgi:hypothetical protein